MDNELAFTLISPHKTVAAFVESFWSLRNHSDSDKTFIVLPDGRADLILTKSPESPLQVTRSGIETYPSQAILAAKTVMFAISFKLPAIEYLFKTPLAGLLNSAEYLPAGFWDFDKMNWQDVEDFGETVTQKIKSLIPPNADERKLRLFELIYSSNGTISVKDLSERVFWSARQINRYFTQQFGLSLKTYCNIIRFRASFTHIKEGKLFPQEAFADQPHFIKEIKKHAGVSPKELSRNQNGRFIQFSVLKP